MESGYTIAKVVAAASAVGLLGNLPTFLLIKNLKLSPMFSVVSYIGSVTVIIFFGILLSAMIVGVMSDWNTTSKALMMAAIISCIPALVGSVILFISGISGVRSGNVGSYLIVDGILNFVVLIVPAAITWVLAPPGGYH